MKTVFGDVKSIPNDSYRIQTESSVYTVTIHEERGRRYVLVRGEPGSDREAVVIRDSDPRVGEHSLFDAADIPGQLPYPQRHVRYAEDVATLLRSIHRRDRLFEDIQRDRDLRERFMNSLDAAEKLLADIKSRCR